MEKPTSVKELETQLKKKGIKHSTSYSYGAGGKVTWHVYQEGKNFKEHRFSGETGQTTYKKYDYKTDKGELKRRITVDLQKGKKVTTEPGYTRVGLTDRQTLGRPAPPPQEKRYGYESQRSIRPTPLREGVKFIDTSRRKTIHESMDPRSPLTPRSIAASRMAEEGQLRKPISLSEKLRAKGKKFETKYHYIHRSQEQIGFGSAAKGLYFAGGAVSTRFASGVVGVGETAHKLVTDKEYRSRIGMAIVAFPGKVGKFATDSEYRGGVIVSTGAALTGAYKEFKQYPIGSTSQLGGEVWAFSKIMKAGSAIIKRGKTEIMIAAGKYQVVDPKGFVSFVGKKTTKTIKGSSRKFGYEKLNLYYSKNVSKGVRQLTGKPQTSAKLTEYGGKTVKFIPEMSEMRSAGFLSYHEGRIVNIAHATQGKLKTSIGGVGQFQSYPKMAESWRLGIKSQHAFFSSPAGKLGTTQVYGGYLEGVRASASASSKSARFSIFKPKNYAYIGREPVGRLSNVLKRARTSQQAKATAINVNIGKRPGKLFVPGENIAGMTTEGQFVASAEFAGSTGTYFKVGKNVGTLVYDQPRFLTQALKLKVPENRFVRLATHQAVPVHVKEISLIKNPALYSKAGYKLGEQPKGLFSKYSRSAEFRPRRSIVKAAKRVESIPKNMASSSVKVIPLSQPSATVVASVLVSSGSGSVFSLSASKSYSSKQTSRRLLSSSAKSALSSSVRSSSLSSSLSSSSLSSVSSKSSPFSSVPSSSKISSSPSSSSKSSSSSLSSLSSSSTTKTPPPPPFFLFDMGGKRKTPKLKQLRKRNQPKGYSPSFRALAFNIKGKISKASEKAGFGLRSIPI